MLTLSLDEYGAFEGIGDNTRPVYIAGLLYDDRGRKADKSEEKKRIRAYYNAVIRDAAVMSTRPVGFEYPTALHSDGDRARDHEVVRLVKEQVRKTLPEFIRKGTYHGKPLTTITNRGKQVVLSQRAGKYYIFVILKSQDGMKRLLDANAAILVRDDYASNLYFNMADEIVSRLLFHNPIIGDVHDVSIDIATRSSATLRETDKLFSEYKEIGYRKIKRGNGIFSFSLTNADVYRTIIADEITASGKTEINIDSFRVSSISYEPCTKYQEFLYLADSICSAFGYKLGGNTADEWLPEITKRAYDLTNSYDNFVFGYDEIDLLYQKAWKKYEEGDYYEALSLAYDAKRRNGVFADHYNRYWFPRIERLVTESNSQTSFLLAIQKLYSSIISNDMDQDKSVYILSVIENLAEHIKDTLRIPETRKYLYQLYDSGVSIYCHIGDSVKAEEYFAKCTDNAKSAGLEEYLNTRNKMSVFCCDNFEHRRAREISEANVTYQEFLSEMKTEAKMEGFREEGTSALGKACSQLAQVMAFERDPGAEKTFRRALTYFDPLSANYKITQSFLLHYYLDQYEEGGYTDAFRKEAKAYFGNEDLLTEQLKYIIDEGTQVDPLINFEYALYVYVRSLYRYRLSEVSKGLLETLRGLEKIVHEKRKKPVLEGHPSELIFMYLSLIERAVGSRKRAQQYEDRIDRCVKNKGTTIEVICRYAHIECANADKDYAKRDRLSADLYRFMFEAYPVAFNGEDTAQGVIDPYAWLNKRITFMYC